MSSNVKQQATEVIERLPQDATIDDVMEKLYFLAKVRRGLGQIEAGEVVSHEEARRRLGR